MYNAGDHDGPQTHGPWLMHNQFKLSPPQAVSDRKTKAHRHKIRRTQSPQTHTLVWISYLSINQSTKPKEDTKREREIRAKEGERQQGGG